MYEGFSIEFILENLNPKMTLFLVSLSNYVPGFHSLAMWFIEGCSAITQGKKMALVSTSTVPNHHFMSYSNSLF